MGNKNDISDKRSCSFLHLCHMIKILNTDSLPRIILLENVVGFEKSKSCQIFRKNLSLRNYCIGHFYFNPTQFGIPNDRPRYYSVSVLPSMNSRIFDSISTIMASLLSHENETQTKKPPINIYTHIPQLGIKHDLDVNLDDLLPLYHFLDDSVSLIDSESVGHQEYLNVHATLLQKKASWCFDIVKSTDKRSSCFTRSYGRFVRGTGSILYIGEKKKTKVENLLQLLSPQKRTFDKLWHQGLNINKNLRYFSGIEIARLMGFPVVTFKIKEQDNLCIFDNRKINFTFPFYCTVRQQWKLLGNSLNVKVAAKIAEFGVYALLHYYYRDCTIDS